MRKHPTNPRNMGVPRSYLEYVEKKNDITFYSDFIGECLNYNCKIDQYDKIYRKTPGPTLAANVVRAILLMYKQ